MNVSIIGVGSMGGAVARGLVASGFPAGSLTLSNPSPGRLAPFAEAGIFTTDDNAVAARRGDIIILAVKPWVVPSVIDEIRETVGSGRKTFVSLAAGIRGDILASSNASAIYMVIPNTAAEVGESMTFVAPVIEGDTECVTELFKRLGDVMVVDERLLPAATMLGSCGIAYAMRYIRAAMSGGVELGLKASEAQKIVAQTVKGAAALLGRDGAHPETEIDKVTTPGGLTIRGLNEMEHAGFTSAVIRGLKAGVKS